MDDSVPLTSIEDEDASDGVVSGKPDSDVLAEVKLPSVVRKCSFHCLL